jgi:glycosyltransferase involved in cell wall biosynthesis
VVLPTSGALARDLQAAGVEVLIRPVSVIRRGMTNPRGLTAMVNAAVRDAGGLTGLIRKRGVELVHSNTSVVLGGAAAALVARVPHVWHVREIYSRFGRAWPAYRQVLTSARALPCVSQATAAQFRPRDPIQVMWDGLAVDARRAPRAQAREALGLDAQAPAIAVLGRISDWKGQDVLVRALADPELRSRGAVGLLAGEAWPGAEARTQRVLELADSLGVRDRLHMLGFREDVESVYGATDVVAVPSTAPDPLPGAAIEAAAAGCAVVASAHGGLPEIVRDGDTGRLVPPGDAAALARVASELIDDPTQRARLGVAAAADVRERFAASRLREAIDALYESILSR